MCGGKGWPVLDEREGRRDPREVAAHMREGYISAESAREVYAVVVDERTGEVDGDGTAGVAGETIHEGQKDAKGE